MQLSANETRLGKKDPATRLAWDGAAALLLLVCVLLVSTRLVITSASAGLTLISFLAILGCVAGLALGRSHFSILTSSLFAILYGAYFIPWQMGLAFFSDHDWNARLRDLGGRVGFAINQFTSGENVEDPILFVASMAILFWFLGVHAGYRFSRYADIWSGLIPFGLVALGIQTYDSRQSWKGWLVALFLLCLLLLLARMQFIRRRQRWEDSRIFIPFELSGSLGKLAFVSAAFLVLLAWATPALASSLDSAESFWDTITSPWRIVRDELNRALFPLQGEPMRVANAFGERFLLGRGIPQSPDILFTVQVIQQDQVPLRYYWQDRVYDQYEDGKWTSSYDELETWEDLSAAQYTNLEGRTNTELLFTAQESVVLLHSALQPISLNRSAEFSFSANEDGTQDIAAIFASSPVLPGESYDVTASIAVPTANQLNSAGIDYPKWVTARYLQLPADFSTRIADLAQSLTEDLSTPYDKTLAITNYLRGELEYVDHMPLAPLDRDPIEWALFEQKQGFCNYYASAEVLMLRSFGIPARLAVGYANGERENKAGRIQYIVRKRDAHAWPEVYFPGIGWVEFEPTASQDPLIRPLINPEASTEDLEHPIRPEEVAATPNVQDSPQLSSEEFFAQEEARRFAPSLLILAALLVVLAVFLFKRYRSEGGLSFATITLHAFERLDIQPPKALKQLARLSELPAMTQAYMQINSALGWLGQPPKPGDTPEQRAEALANRLPSLREETLTLSQDYQSHHYGEAKLTREERAIQIMKQIRWAARKEQVKNWLRTLLHRKY